MAKERMSEAPKKVEIPPMPATKAALGEYTPEVLGWYKKYKPEVFKLRYEDKVKEFDLEVKEV